MLKMSDSLIKLLGSMANVELTLKAEAAHPKQAAKTDYSETEKTIVEMLTESTGAHFLDSGGAYGRNWEYNRKIADFREQPQCDVKIEADCISIHYNLFHFLNNHCIVTEQSKKLQTEYEQLLKEYPDSYEYEIVEDFTKQYGEGSTLYNTYNNETLLSQGFLYCIFDAYDTQHKNVYQYVLIKTHNGCDIRGGYSQAKIFQINGDSDYFIIDMQDLDAHCQCGYCNAYSDDCGYNWNCEESTSHDYKDLLNLNKITQTPNIKFEDRYSLVDDKAVCKRCNTQLEFSVRDQSR